MDFDHFCDDYLKRILTSAVYDVAIESPLDVAPNLSRRTGNTILLKREDMQPVFAAIYGQQILPSQDLPEDTGYHSAVPYVYR